MQGFLVNSFQNEVPAAIDELRQWIKEVSIPSSDVWCAMLILGFKPIIVFYFSSYKYIIM